MLCLFAVWYDWGGGLAWGPRFALPVIPLLIPLLLPVLEGQTRTFARGLLWVLVALSTAIQLAAATTSYLVTVPGSPWPVLTAFHRLAKVGFRGLDIAWLSARPQPQWLPLALFFAGRRGLAGRAGFVGIVQVAGAAQPARQMRFARFLPLPLLALLFVACAVGLLRIHTDQRLPAGDDYRALAAGLAQAAHSSDTVLLDNHTRMEFFLSEDRSRAPRYDLLRSDTLSAPAAELLTRLTGQPRRALAHHRPACRRGRRQARRTLARRARFPLARDNFQPVCRG